MVRQITEAVGDGITMRTARLQVLDGSGVNDADLCRQFLSTRDRFNEPWSNHAKLIPVLRERYFELKAAQPADPKLRAKLSRPRASEFAYIQEAVRLANLVEKYVHSRPWEAVSRAMEMMELLTELSFKDAHEKDALDGQQLREAREAAARQNRKQPPEVRVRYVNELMASGLRKCAAMQAAADYFGVSYGAIKKDIYPK